MKVSIEKPGSPQELAHHGVKGMKWGHRRSKEFAQQYPTGKSRAKEIYRARARSQKRYTDYVTEQNPAKRGKLKQVYLDHPDRATALRTTRGEKVVLAVLAGGLAPTGVGIGIGAGLATRTAFRRNVEKKQATGAYRS